MLILFSLKQMLIWLNWNFTNKVKPQNNSGLTVNLVLELNIVIICHYNI